MLKKHVLIYYSQNFTIEIYIGQTAFLSKKKQSEKPFQVSELSIISELTPTSRTDGSFYSS